MKKFFSARYILGALAVPLILAFVLANTASLKRTPASQKKRATADDARTLREKAKANGHFKEVKSPGDEGGYVSLDDLASRSSAVIIGIPRDNMSKLSPDGKDITIDYEVMVRYAYKGALRRGDKITVSLPGGRVTFEDGSTAEVSTPWFRKMLNGQTYALFLSKSDAGTYVVTGGAMGLFGTPAPGRDGRVETHSMVSKDPMSKKYQGMEIRAFSKELRRAIKK